jgi:hypothetical protein
MRLSDARVQGIRDIALTTSVKSVRSFIGMVNYFRDFMGELSEMLIPLFELTKKRWTTEKFKLTHEAKDRVQRD